MFQQRVPLQRNPVSPSRAITRRRYQRYTRYTYLRASHAMKKKNALLKARPNAIFTARFPARGWLKSKVTHRPYKATRFDVSLVPSFSIAPFSRFLALSAAALAWPRNYRSVRVACLSTRRGQTSRVISRARFQLHSTAYFARRKPRCSVPDTISWRNLIDRENKLSLRGLGKSWRNPGNIFLAIARRNGSFKEEFKFLR